MGDPLTVGASIVGIVVPAIHALRLLHDDLNKITDAPKTVESLKADLNLAESDIRLLEAIQDADWDLLGETIASQSKEAIAHCGKACGTFHSSLQRWTKRSQNGKLSWRDRATLGFFKAQQVDAMSRQLQTCKLTLAVVVGIANLYSSIRANQMTQEIRDLVAKQAADLTTATASTQGRLENAERSLTAVRAADVTQLNEVEEEDHENAMWQLEEETASLRISRMVLEELKSHSDSGSVERVAQQSQDHAFTVSFGQQNSGFQLGVNHGPISGITFGRS